MDLQLVLDLLQVQMQSLRTTVLQQLHMIWEVQEELDLAVMELVVDLGLVMVDRLLRVFAWYRWHHRHALCHHDPP